MRARPWPDDDERQWRFQPVAVFKAQCDIAFRCPSIPPMPSNPTADSTPPAAFDARFDEVYDRLKSMAHRELGRGGSSSTVNTTELVHELYLKLGNGRELQFAEPTQFFCYAARAMRHILVDRARHRLRFKVGGDQLRVSLTDPAVNSIQLEPSRRCCSTVRWTALAAAKRVPPRSSSCTTSPSSRSNRSGRCWGGTAHDRSRLRLCARLLLAQVNSQVSHSGRERRLFTAMSTQRDRVSPTTLPRAGAVDACVELSKSPCGLSREQTLERTSRCAAVELGADARRDDLFETPAATWARAEERRQIEAMGARQSAVSDRVAARARADRRWCLPPNARSALRPSRWRSADAQRPVLEPGAARSAASRLWTQLSHPASAPDRCGHQSAGIPTSRWSACRAHRSPAPTHHRIDARRVCAWSPPCARRRRRASRADRASHLKPSTCGDASGQIRSSISGIAKLIGDTTRPRPSTSRDAG